MDIKERYKNYRDLYEKGIISATEFENFKRLLLENERDSVEAEDSSQFFSELEEVVVDKALTSTNKTQLEEVKEVYTKKPFFQRNVLSAEEFRALENSFNKRWEELSQIHNL